MNAARPTAQHVLVINAGSSSLKYQVVDASSGAALATGLIERIGEKTGQVSHTVGDCDHEREVDVPDHAAAMAAMSEAFSEHGPDLAGVNLAAVGHRVVQGGPEFSESVLITPEVEAAIEDVSDLAPLHNPPNLAGIRAARETFSDLPQVAVFDTAFHRTMPAHAATYALDREVAQAHRIRRYGAHGTSHQYVARAAAHELGIAPEQANLIILHLGNGASATAVANGNSVDTSMGLTPLEGLVMGTRTGDIDPAVVFHLARTAGMDIDAIDTIMNRRSGLLGLAGSNDMRDVEAGVDAGDENARLALEVYCYRLRKYIGAYTAVLGRVDAVVFTAGIGENSAPVRARTLAGLESLGISLDPVANETRGTVRISTAESRVAVLVVPTNEEWEIAREAVAVLGG
ncbi:acetate/propionate family kinase [Ruania halotolerans]|uniref:acetate/propionate family kinase n=1 Tax=Ruania halotolerans TaxID=2897773 RepID=UPI001E517038|nr:acetate kinase [Ruania halotolerans]UFU05670.1 acetate kinase [Ruania halotolerans]